MIRDPKLLLTKMKELARQVTALRIDVGAVGLIKTSGKMYEAETAIYEEIQEKTDELAGK
jgi:phage tail tape-measure protein